MADVNSAPAPVVYKTEEECIPGNVVRDDKGNLLYSQSHGAFFMYEHQGKRGLWCQLSEAELKGDIKNKQLEQLVNSIILTQQKEINLMKSL